MGPSQASLHFPSPDRDSTAGRRCPVGETDSSSNSAEGHLLPWCQQPVWPKYLLSIIPVGTQPSICSTLKNVKYKSVTSAVTCQHEQRFSFACTSAVWSIMKSVQPTAFGPLPGGIPRWLLQLLPMVKKLSADLLWSGKYKHTHVYINTAALQKGKIAALKIGLFLHGSYWLQWTNVYMQTVSLYRLLVSNERQKLLHCGNCNHVAKFTLDLTAEPHTIAHLTKRVKVFVS